MYRGAIAEALLGGPGGSSHEATSSAYEARWAEPVEVPYAGTRFLTRGGLSGVPALLARLPRLPGCRRRSACSRSRTFSTTGAPRGTRPTSASVDAEGRAVVLTSSLGLGSGDFLPGLDLHLNSMLGEKDLIVGALEPGARMQSMMAPSLAVDARRARDGDRLCRRHAAADGARPVAAGGARRRPSAAGGGRPSALPSAGETINAEPGVDEEALRRSRRRPQRPPLARPAPLFRRHEPRLALRRRRRSTPRRPRGRALGRPLRGRASASTSRAIWSISACSLSKARSSRRRCQSSTTRRLP